MHPFFPSLPNQIQPQGGNGQALQQVMLSNPHQFPNSSCPHHNPLGFNNSPQVPSQPHGLNQQIPIPSMQGFNNQNTLFNTLHGNNTVMPNRPHLMPSPGFPNGPNVPQMTQNNNLGMPPPHGHLCAHNLPQNLNQIAALPLRGQFCNVQQNIQQLHGQHRLRGRLQNSNRVPLLQPDDLFWSVNPTQNFNQIMGLPHGQFCSQNPMLHGNQIMPLQCPQHPSSSTQIGPLNVRQSSPLVAFTGSHNPGILGNPLLSMDNLNPNFSNNLNPLAFGAPSPMCQNAIQKSPAASQKSQQSISSSPMRTQQTRKNLHPSGLQQPQVNLAEMDGSNISNGISGNPTGKKFTRNLHGSGERDSPHFRFQKSQFHHMRNAKGAMKPFNQNGVKGQYNRRERKPQFANCDKQAWEECQRPIPVNYTEEEIRQWCEARKKNFPTATKIEKKLARSNRNQEVIDGDARLRRQQLKEVLAKQAELGVEVAEIPPSYLSEPDNQVSGRKNERKAWKTTDQFPNKYNKRGRHGRNKWRAKKPKLENEASTAPIQNKREPTLLQKLLSTDIKRDKSRLLQVFRFMVSNSFFDHWPNKPLEFPSVTVEDIGGEVDAVDFGLSKNMVEEIEGQKDPGVVDEGDEGSSENDSGGSSDDEVIRHSISNEDHVRDQGEKSEEGEISD